MEGETISVEAKDVRESCWKPSKRRGPEKIYPLRNHFLVINT